MEPESCQSSLPDLSSALGVDQLTRWYRAAFHGHLAIGRAIGSQCPTIAPLRSKWLVVSVACTLVLQAARWARRLDELGVPQPEVGSAPEAVTALAARLCTLPWAEALVESSRYLGAWQDELARLELHDAALQFDDARLVGRAQERLNELLEHLRAAGYGCDESAALRLRPEHMVDVATATTPTGTPPLPIPVLQSRAYPPPSADVRTPAPDAPESERLAMFLHHTLQIEYIGCDIVLRNLAEHHDMPLAFYVDMARQAHDEMRHAWLLEHCLARLGHGVGDFEFDLPDRFDLLISESLVFRLVVLARTGESEAIESLSSVIPQLESLGEVEIARMWDYVRADETRHAGIGNRWLRHLVGDDDAAVAAATAASLERYNHAVEQGRLHRPPRPIDYLRSPGLPIDPRRRSHAGFTAEEIAILAESRGVAESSTPSTPRPTEGS